MSKKSSSSLSSASCSVMLLGCSAKAGRNRQRCHKPLSRNERMRVCVGGKSWRGRGNTFAQLTFAMRPLNFVTAAASVTNRMRQLVSRSSAAAAVIETAHSDTSTHGEQKRTWERDHKPQGWVLSAERACCFGGGGCEEAASLTEERTTLGCVDDANAPHQSARDANCQVCRLDRLAAPSAHTTQHKSAQVSKSQQQQ